MVFFASKDQIIEKFPSDHCVRKQIKIKFNNDEKMDASILQILEGELDNCLSAAEHYREKGDYVQALSKCEEAYVNYC